MDARALEHDGRELRGRRWEIRIQLALALVGGTLWALATMFDHRVAVVFAVGGLVAALFASCSAVRYRWLIERLARDPDAYVISSVRRYGRGLTCQWRRRQFSRSLRTLVAEPWRRGPMIPPARVEAFADELEELAHALDDVDNEVEAVSAATCRHLLSDGAESPLLNPSIPLEDLRATLWRIRSGIRKRA